jgi:autophagy-related protein 5
VTDNFDDYWRVAAKVTPTPAAAAPARPASPPGHTRPPSADPQGATSAADRDGAYAVRSVPVRVYLPDGPVIQDLAPPLLEDGACGLAMCLPP